MQGVAVPTTPAPRPAAAADPIASVFSKLFAGDSGRKIYLGVLQRDVDPDTVPSMEERAGRRDNAARELVNIDDDERERRLYVGGALSVVTLALGAFLLTSHAPAVERLAIAPPLFLSYGYIASWQKGL